MKICSNKEKRRASHSGRFRQLLGMLGLVLMATTASSRGDTDYTYYTSDYAYDNLSQTWHDMSVIVDGQYGTCAEPGYTVYVTGGEHWRGHTYASVNYNYDYVADIWFTSSNAPCGNPIAYVGDGGPGTHLYQYYSEGYAFDVLTNTWYDQTLFGSEADDGSWASTSDPTSDPGVTLQSEDSYTATNIDGAGYVTVGGNWYVADGETGGYDLTSDPTASWTVLTVEGTQYAHDTSLDVWYSNDGEGNWSVTDDPTANWEYPLTIDGAAYAHDTVMEDWFVDAASVWTSTSDPTVNWEYSTMPDGAYYAQDTETEDWFVEGDEGVWTTSADPSTIWEYPGGFLQFGVNYDYAHNTVTDDWFYDNDGWVSADSPYAHYYDFYSYAFAYDTLHGVWYDETLTDPDSGFWEVCGSPYLFGNPNYDPGDYIGSGDGS